MHSTVLLTGATGFIGRHWTYELLMGDRDVRVVAITRGASREQAAARLKANVVRAARSRSRTISEADLDRIEVILGDVTRHRFGLERSELKELEARGVEEMWHLAATTEFDPAQAQETARINVEGTANAVDVAEAAGVRRLIHMSSSYVCGLVTGEVPEALHALSSPFANPYEASKCRCEHLVAERCDALALDYRIFRPSVVVGPALTYAADGARHGFYGFMRALSRAAAVILAAPAPLRIEADAETQLNLVPVDVLMTVMQRIRRQGYPGGPIYHVTATESPTIETALGAVCDSLGLPRFVLRPPGSLAAPTALEAALADAVRKYAGYLQYPKRFQRSVGPRITVSAEDVSNLCSAWVAERELRAVQKATRPTPVEAPHARL